MIIRGTLGNLSQAKKIQATFIVLRATFQEICIFFSFVKCCYLGVIRTDTMVDGRTFHACAVQSPRFRQLHHPFPHEREWALDEH